MKDQVTRAALAPGEAVDAARLARLGLLQAGEGCVISPLAVFIPADAEGAIRPVKLGAGCLLLIGCCRCHFAASSV